MTRKIDEWIGKTDDTAIPNRVRLRVFDRDKGVCQCGCGWKITAGWLWETDHKVALIAGGKNRETNLQTLLTAHHKTKTRADVAMKSRTYRKRKSTLGIKKRHRTIPGRRFDGTPIPSRWVG